MNADQYDEGANAQGRRVGVGSHPQPWPEDPHFDPELLAEGDSRNVGDEYRYWTLAAIVEDLDTRRHDFHVAVENWGHDFNIGSIVRTANAFLAARIHIIGRRRWNRRGAMVTDRYQHIDHHPETAGFLAAMRREGLAIIGIDNVPGSRPIERAEIPRRCVLVFGEEGPGLSPEVIAECDAVLSISQFGSTRSINAGAAGAVAMHAWVRQHAAIPDDEAASNHPSEVNAEKARGPAATVGNDLNRPAAEVTVGNDSDPSAADVAGNRSHDSAVDTPRTVDSDVGMPHE